MLRTRLKNFLKILAITLVMVILFTPEWPRFQDERHAINVIIGQRYFDFVLWESNAVIAKSKAALTQSQNYLSPSSQKETVLDYLELMGEIRQLNAQISFIYSDPSQADPDISAKDLQEELEKRRNELGTIQPIAESIIQDQIATILIEEGFTLLNQSWPPVQMRVTPLPYVLIVSPREEIRQIYNLSLEHGLTLSEREIVEASIFDSVDRSALIVPISGIGIFPAMVIETGNINHFVSTIAHEWTHHWLSLQPLGVRYAANPGMRTINETVANIVGDEVGKAVIERYYPEFAPDEAKISDESTTSAEPDEFNFNLEMRETRIQVDELLASGKVEEAEVYMEARRQFFWENGYRIRKINQAYFAFYGAYADRPGRQGEDPIGPALSAIRESSNTLKGFLEMVGTITNLEDLKRLTNAYNP